MPLAPPMTGNGLYIPPIKKCGDWGMIYDIVLTTLYPRYRYLDELWRSIALIVSGRIQHGDSTMTIFVMWINALENIGLFSRILLVHLAKSVIIH